MCPKLNRKNSFLPEIFFGGSSCNSYRSSCNLTLIFLIHFYYSSFIMFHLFIHLSIANNFVHSFLRSIQYFFSIFKSNLLPPFLLYILFILHAKYFPSLFIVLLHASVPPFSVPCFQLRFAINSTSFLHLISILILIYFNSKLIIILFYILNFNLF